jgi:arylsulfatase A-like enzyme
MSRNLFLAAGVLVASVALAQAPADAPADHVVLISIDGFRPDFYRDASWPAPTLQQMAREGTHAEGVRSVFPSVTYPSHTTIVTGALPARHGIVYNSPFEPEGQTGRWFWEFDFITTPTLWDAVGAAGRTSASLLWPVTVGAPIDYNLPEYWSLDAGYGSIEPMRWHDTPEGFVEELEREASGRLDRDRSSGDYMTRDLATALNTSYVLARYQPALTTVHLLGVDHFQHSDGRDSARVRQVVAAVDVAVREMIEGAQRGGIADRTAFIITGDHGFVDVHTVLAPNVWLAAAGLLEPTRDRGDWRAAFHTTGGSALLHLRDSDDRDAVDEVRRILESRPRAERRLFRVVERDELDRIGADPAAALGLALIPGVSSSSSARGAAVRPGRGGTHGYFPDFEAIETGFIGWGAGFREGVVLAHMGLEDVAPVVAGLLGIEFDAPDGALPAGLLQEPR